MEKGITKQKNLIKIAIVGPESTGKSTLSEQLANFYDTVWVPEYARDYINKLNRPYILEDIIEISKGQLQWEDEQEKKAKRLLICDTNLVVNKIWAEHAYGVCPDWIKENLLKRHYDIYLLMNTDISWKPDPQREHPHLREHLFKLYENLLFELKVNYIVISGTGEERLKNAIKNINHFLKHNDQ